MFCYIYVLTHNDKIIILHSIEINNTKTTNLLSTLDEKLKEGKIIFLSFAWFLSCVLAVSTPEQLRDVLHPCS